jgi:phosphohistidine phosphatase
MDLYIVRHAVAFDRDAERWPDDRERPLTPRGTRRFRRMARGIVRIVPELDTVLSSPLLRARQTAAILEKEAGWPAADLFPELEPGRAPGEVLRGLKSRARGDALALVGHEPGLHDLLGHLLLGPGAKWNGEMKKGAVAKVVFDQSVQAGAGRLEWLLTTKAVISLRR